MDNEFFRNHFLYKIEIIPNKETIEFFNRYYESRGKYKLGYREHKNNIGKRLAIQNKRKVDYAVLESLGNQNDCLRKYNDGSITIYLYDENIDYIMANNRFNCSFWKKYEKKIKILTKFMSGYNIVKEQPI